MNWSDVPGYLCIGILVFVGIAFLWFWIKMLAEAASETDSSHRIAWLLIVFFGGLLGAIIYALVRRPRRIDEERAEDAGTLLEMRAELSGTSARTGSANDKLLKEMAAAYRRHQERG